MRLRGWHVEGFGLLHNFRVEGLPDGLTVVFGPNEAGKTSLLAFIRGALFGYPDRRHRDRQYPPLRGGRHGGRLFLESDGSAWTVERFASPAHLSITQPDGSLGTEADLRRLLGRVDAELHRNVFAFSLFELQEFESLQVEGVKDRIFAAGVVGAGRSARAAIEAFAGQRAEIGKKRGECRINTLRRRAEELDEFLRQARSRAARHPELRRLADDLDEEQRGLGRRLSDARHEMASLDSLLAAWPDWDERGQAEAELATLAESPDLADDLGTRLDSSLVAARTQRERHEEREQAVQSLEQQLAALVPDERLAAVFGGIKRLAGQIGSVRARRERLGELRTQYDILNKRIAEEAPRLGAGWTSNSVREFDASIPAAQVIADWGERLRGAEQAVRDAEDQATQLGSSSKEMADEASRRTDALKSAPALPETKDLAERDAAVRRLRTKIAQLLALRADLQAAMQRLTEATRRATEARDAAAAKDFEVERRSTALGSAPELPTPDDLARRGRAVRELRTGLAELAVARADLRAASQRALDAKRRADEAELTASAGGAEVERREEVLASAHSVPEAESLVVHERAARELRSKLADLAVLRSELRSAEIRLVDRQSDAKRRVAPVTMSSTKRPLLAVAAVLGIVAVVLVLVSQFVAAGVAFATAVVAVILAMRSPIASSATSDGPSTGIAEAERSVQELAARIGKLEGAATPLGTRLGFSSLPDQVDLDARADEISAQSRARSDRDREVAAIDQLRAEAQRARETTARLGTIATNVQTEIDDVVSQRVRDLEAADLSVARSLGFAQLPSVAALEDKAAEVADLVVKRHERESEVSAVRALRLDTDRARDLAARLDKEVADLRGGVESSQTRVDATEESARAEAVSLGLPAIPEATDLEVKAKEIDDQIRARQERDREATVVRDLMRRTGAVAESARQASAKSAAPRLDGAAAHTDWSAWKAAHQCPEALRPETAQQFFASVERLRESLGQLDGMEAETTNITAEIQDFSREVHALAERTDFSHAIETALAEDVLEGLRERAETDAKIRAEHARVSSELERARSAQVTSERTAAAAAKLLERVLVEAGASDERDCRARIETSRRRADLRRGVREAEHRLHTRLGAGTSADAVRAELTSGDRQGWEARKQECKATLAQSQPAYEDAVRRHQTAVESLSALERECDVITLATEREGVVAEIRGALSEWRHLAIAESLVQGTLRRYELERQPAVLTRAAASFSRITDGRYTRLVTREDVIDVIAADGGRLDAAALSRGTAEQLYLCLRLALAAEFGRLAVPLPLVMDDVLVNFDPERARLSAQVLIDATVEHQILLFTCHPETVDLLIDLAPSVNVVRIQRQTPVARPVEAIATGLGLDSAAPPRTSARQTASRSLPDFGEAVLSSIREAEHPLSRSEILASTGMAHEHWAAVIQELRNNGLVLSRGSKRGTTWGLAGSPTPDKG